MGLSNATRVSDIVHARPARSLAHLCLSILFAYTIGRRVFGVACWVHPSLSRTSALVISTFNSILAGRAACFGADIDRGDSAVERTWGDSEVLLRSCHLRLLRVHQADASERSLQRRYSCCCTVSDGGFRWCLFVLICCLARVGMAAVECAALENALCARLLAHDNHTAFLLCCLNGARVACLVVGYKIKRLTGPWSGASVRLSLVALTKTCGAFLHHLSGGGAK